MPSRRRSRQRALQILYLWDARRQPVDEAINAYYETLYSEEQPERDPFVASLVRGTVQHVTEVDERITRHAEHWRLDRMATVDRNLLRLATQEFLFDRETPRTVVINEGIVIARRFSTQESPQFINGILDSIKKELEG